MKENVVTELKRSLYEEVNKLEKENKSKENKKGIIDMLSSIVDVLEIDDYEEMYENSKMLSILIEIIYNDDPKHAKKIKEKIDSITFLLNEYSRKNLMNCSAAKLEEQKLNGIREIFKKEIEQLKTKQPLSTKENEETIKMYRSIISNFKYNNIIDSKQITAIDNYMKEIGKDEKEQVKMLEAIKIHNSKVTKNNNPNVTINSNKYNILNMLEMGYELIEPVYIEDKDSKKRVETVSNSYIEVLKTTKEIYGNFLELLPNLESDTYSFEEFDAILKNILIYLQNKLFDDVELIIDKEIYLDIKMREEVETEYKKDAGKYNSIRNYYLKQIDNYEKELVQNEEKKPVNNLYYSTIVSGEIDSTSYFEKDLKKISHEYLIKVRILLDKLKQGHLSRNEQKMLSSNNNNYTKLQELRDDQIRIVFLHIAGNNYIILGCEVKKSDNDRSFYQNMSNRPTYIDIDEETRNKRSKIIEDRIFKYVEDNKRTGTR